ncbi:hypothetical protein HPB50_018754 [Hyalomma asiaticum]|uniref:Uncharacterized protein n=1 Tax=Hyalomma asiaticum TaxID=266040 RepID=A0ACB7S1U6_HYAAI|nr:hypothetical protein HPB50_018754 [Hyalomma asiaticum]
MLTFIEGSHSTLACNARRDYRPRRQRRGGSHCSYTVRRGTQHREPQLCKNRKQRTSRLDRHRHTTRFNSSFRTLLRVSLPKLQEPVFSGILAAFSGIETFTYLRPYLTGSAKRAIEGVRLEQANYAAAVKLLQERFGRHTALVGDHVDCLLAIAPVGRCSQLSQLRELYEEVRFRTGCLDSLGVPASE